MGNAKVQDDNEQLNRLELEMEECDKELDRCVREHSGGAIVSFAEYMHKVRDLSTQHPPLPPAFTDAAELQHMVLQFRKGDTAEALRLKEIEQKLEALTPTIEQEKRQLLEGEREQVARAVKMQEQDALMRAWGILMPNGVTVMDGVGFRAELSKLLKRKLELLCEHRLATAKRVLKIRAQTVVRDPEFVKQINMAADRFQAQITGAQASNAVLPLRHEYAWHAHFPSLVEKIPESLPSNGDPPFWLLDLSMGIEKDRAAAVAASHDLPL